MTISVLTDNHAGSHTNAEHGLSYLIEFDIFPSHCTELPALCAFHKAFNIRQLKTGDILTF